MAPVSRIDSIRKLLAGSPDDVFLLYGLGMELLGADRPAEAAEQFRRVLELDGKYLAAYAQAAKALQQAGHRIAAADLLRRGLAVAEQAGDRHTKERLALLLAALGEGV